MKRFIIWLFKLNNLKSLYIAERQRQRKWDEKEFQDRIATIEEKYERQISIMQQSHDAEIAMIGIQLEQYKKREKELSEREYNAKIQLKKNTNTAAQLFNHIFNVANLFQKEAAEVQKFIDDAQMNTQYYIK